MAYVSIDKPQNKYYRNKAVRKVDPNKTMYRTIFDLNCNNMDWNAISYMNKDYTYSDLKKMVDNAASCFFEDGIKEGDVVLVGLSNTPEAIVSLLALNKIGAISKWFDLRASESDIEEYLDQNNCEYVIALDMLINKIKNLNAIERVKKVYVVSPVAFSNIGIRFLYKLKKRYSIPKEKKYIKYKKVLKEEVGKVEESTFCKEKPAIMIQSSGTTGKPKVIVHSNYSATSAVKKLAYSDLPIEEGKMLLDLLPPWIAYAIGNAILYPLSLGCKVILSPTFEPNAIMAYLGKFTISMAAPFHYRYLRDNYKTLKKGVLKRFEDSAECFISGGDKISVEENRDFETLFGIPVVNGYGNNEGWGCLTVNSVIHNHYGSVGIPKYMETIIAWDSNKKCELPYNEVGEICALTDTMFLEYANNKDDTSLVKQTHSDGKVWLHTGDLGYIDNDGFVHLEGRMRRVIVRGGFRISAYTIEDKITEHKSVKECVAVEVEDLLEEHVPMAFVVLVEGADQSEIKKQLLKKCKNELKEYEIPKYFEFVTELPYTQNGKYDFRKLEIIGNNSIKQDK